MGPKGVHSIQVSLYNLLTWQLVCYGLKIKATGDSKYNDSCSVMLIMIHCFCKQETMFVDCVEKNQMKNSLVNFSWRKRVDFQFISIVW